MRGVQSLSAITAALRDEEEDSDDAGPMDEEDTALEDVDNPRWQLYETIKNTTNNQGTVRYRRWSSGLLCYLAFWLRANILEEHSSLIFNLEDGGTVFL
jgi:hypothetical protein